MQMGSQVIVLVDTSLRIKPNAKPNCGKKHCVMGNHKEETHCARLLAGGDKV